MDFPNDAANDIGSPSPAMVNGVEERPILDEMIARMQQEQDERAAAGSSSGHQQRARSSDQQSTSHRDQATATGIIISLSLLFCLAGLIYWPLFILEHRSLVQLCGNFCLVIHTCICFISTGCVLLLVFCNKWYHSVNLLCLRFMLNAWLCAL